MPSSPATCQTCGDVCDGDSDVYCSRACARDDALSSLLGADRKGKGRSTKTKRGQWQRNYRQIESTGLPGPTFCIEEKTSLAEESGRGVGMAGGSGSESSASSKKPRKARSGTRARPAPSSGPAYGRDSEEAHALAILARVERQDTAWTDYAAIDDGCMGPDARAPFEVRDGQRDRTMRIEFEPGPAAEPTKPRTPDKESREHATRHSGRRWWRGFSLRGLLT